METNYIKVKYEDDINPKTFAGKVYYYYTTINLSIGDIVEAPTIYGNKIARVSQINVPEKEVEHIKSLLKPITLKINKYEYINNSKIKKMVA